MSLIDELMLALRCLPGVGPRSAQRMTLHLLERERDGARRLARLLEEAATKVGRCRSCRTLSVEEICPICANARRDPSLLCVIETPADLLAVEQTAAYSGLYFVLMGRLSPLDGLGPAELGLEQLAQRLSAREVREVILATNPTVEGEATAHYIGEMAAARGIRATRIAHGVPLGGELGYVDGATLSHALAGRFAIATDSPS